MADQKNRRGRLSLNKKGKNVKQSATPSIVDMFKRQDSKATPHTIVIDDNDDDVEVIGETTSPYFSRGGRKGSEQRKSSKSRSISKGDSPRATEVDESSVTGRVSNVDEDCVGNRSTSACSGEATNESEPTPITGCLGDNRSTIGDKVGGLVEVELPTIKRKDSLSPNEGTARKRLKLSRLKLTPCSQGKGDSEKHEDQTQDNGEGDTHLTKEQKGGDGAPSVDIKGGEATQSKDKKGGRLSLSKGKGRGRGRGRASQANTTRGKGVERKTRHTVGEEGGDVSIIIDSDGTDTSKCEVREGADTPLIEHTDHVAGPLHAEDTARGDVSHGKDKGGDDTPAIRDVEEGDAATTEDVEDITYRVPYYLENFQTILTSVRGDEYYARLFNKEDSSVMADFDSLAEEGQKLYIRLFQRKLRWLRAGQIQYPQISEDLGPILQQLVDKKFLMDENQLDDLSEVLHALPAPDLRVLTKGLRLASTDPRPVLIEAVLKHARQKSIGAFFTVKNQGSNEKSVLKRARSMLGRCYKVGEETRWVFMRAMMLFSLHTITGDEDESTNNQLFQMLQTNIGQITYPKYTVSRQTEIFRSRDELLIFCSAVQVAADLREAVEANNLNEALKLYEHVKPEADRLLKDSKLKKRATQLPEHLRWLTAGAGYTRALTWGVELLQKSRDYQGAVKQLQELLAQRTYNTDYRGRWYERLALNLQTHLKQPEKALAVIREGLEDPCVRVGHRLAIWQRAQKMCTTASLKKLHHHWDHFKDDPMAAVKEAPKVTIEGRQISVPGAQTLSSWCTEDSGSGEVTFIRRVEDVALRHYAQHGYPQGLHGEGGTLSVILSLLFWDVLFADVPDAFINAYQSAPLDLYTDRFYTARQEQTDQRLKWLAEATLEEIEEEITQSWTTHENTSCVGLSWERFEDVDEAKGLVRCIGGSHLSQIFSRMLKNLRFTRSGFPDLIVWNTETKEFKVVEVKGPGDRLSTKQILWLDYFNQIGVDAEVCYVVAVGAKKLR